MMLLVFVLLTLVVALATGGKIRHLARVQIKYSYVILVALAIQVLVFSSWWQRLVPQILWSQLLYGLSLALLIVVVTLNFTVLGFPLIALGLLLNSLVILLNGGRMPASLSALQIAGIADATQAYAAARATNSALITASTRLWYLGDIFAFPKTWPLPNVFSIGDVYIALGAVWFVWASVHPKRD
jgi:hypothetical protein